MINKIVNPRKDLAEVQEKKLNPFPNDLEIETVEYFDELGLMMSRTPVGVIEKTRSKDKEMEFFAVYINGELGYFQEKASENPIFNRIQNISKKVYN